MFENHIEWTNQPCHYVMAYDGNRRAWLKGPYRTLNQAERALPGAVQWALRHSGDDQASRYRYEIYQHFNGQTRSILGATIV